MTEERIKKGLAGIVILLILIFTVLLVNKFYLAIGILLVFTAIATCVMLLIMGMFCGGPMLGAGLNIVNKNFQKKYGDRPEGEIVFYGASNFTFWKTLEEDMSPYKTQNHGFGGSTDELMKNQAYRMLYPYKPSVVFIQTGSNDNARGLSLDEIIENKKKLYAEYLENLPNTLFIVMSGLPLPGRPEFWDNINSLNKFLADYCKDLNNLEFVDATSTMLNEEGDFRPEYFISDGIHLNAEGHKAWTNLMLEKLNDLNINA